MYGYVIIGDIHFINIKAKAIVDCYFQSKVVPRVQVCHNRRYTFPPSRSQCHCGQKLYNLSRYVITGDMHILHLTVKATVECYLQSEVDPSVQVCHKRHVLLLSHSQGHS